LESRRKGEIEGNGELKTLPLINADDTDQGKEHEKRPPARVPVPHENRGHNATHPKEVKYKVLSHHPLSL
jgi:hypothetical protein